MAINKLSFAEKLIRFPPVVVRLLARVYHGPGPDGCEAICDDEIARNSGLQVEFVRQLSKLTTWDHVEWAIIVVFLRGCGVDLDERAWVRRNTRYMKELRSLPRYLIRSPHWRSTFEPLIRIWVQTK